MSTPACGNAQHTDHDGHDHSPAPCGIEGHYNCDGKNHALCDECGKPLCDGESHQH